MSMPAEQGMSVLYVLADQWVRERQLLRALGVEDPAPLDVLVGRVPVKGEETARRDRRAVALALGGEVIGSHGAKDR
jgi:hypothetical protein